MRCPSGERLSLPQTIHVRCEQGIYEFGPKCSTVPHLLTACNENQFDQERKGQQRAGLEGFPNQGNPRDVHILSQTLR